MPKDYSQTLDLLKQDITDDEMAPILWVDNPDLANRKILNCLILKMKTREQMLDFCDQLEKVIISQDLKRIVDEIKIGNLHVRICIVQSTYLESKLSIINKISINLCNLARICHTDF